MPVSYEEFLAAKHPRTDGTGHHISQDAIHPLLFPFQRDIVQWAVERGRAAIWASTGLGKTFQQLEWARLLGQRTLIFAPLAVAHQTVMEAHRIDIKVTYCRNQEEADDASSSIIITNYDMAKHFTPQSFGAVIAEESSILKNTHGVMKKQLIAMCEQVPYRLACSATPAPNDHVEIGNHAEWLGIMPASEMLARWFINDSGRTGVFRLKRHAVHDFWEWVSSWAVCCTLPSDIDPSYDDSDYLLPPLNILTHSLTAEASASYERGTLFPLNVLSATDIWKDKRATALERCELAAKIVMQCPDVPWILWCDTNDESSRLAALLPEAQEVRGDQSLALKESGIRAFSERRTRIMITKADVCGMGLNWQHCADVLFVGQTFSFEKEYQALRRSWRFGQRNPVNAHFICIDTETNIRQALARKHADHEHMQEAMREATRIYGLSQRKARNMSTPDQIRHEGDGWTLYEGDCVQSLMNVENDSVALTVTSVPFSNLFVYSDSIADMGNCKDNAEFFAHMDYLIPALHRVTLPGRLCCIHCKDLPLWQHRDGVIGFYDFPGEVIRRFVQAGWVFHSRITIWKNPATEMQRTKAHGLLHKHFQTRAEVCRQGMPDFVLVFRKWTDEMPDKQVRHDVELGEFIGTDPPPIEEPEIYKGAHTGQTHVLSPYEYSIKIWQRYASPVWFDIDQQRMLPYREAREADDERHLCPLQLDVIERCVWLWSNEGETVLDPFNGIASTGYVSLQQGRSYIGCEIKSEYVNMSIKNLESATATKKQLTLF